MLVCKKNCGTDFRNLDFKIFGEFFEILRLDFSAAAAVEISRPTGLTSQCLARHLEATGAVVLKYEKTHRTF